MLEWLSKHLGELAIIGVVLWGLHYVTSKTRKVPTFLG